MNEAELQEILDDASERLSLGGYSNADAAVHDLVAEVRRLTAALAAARREGAEFAQEQALGVLTDRIARVERARAQSESQVSRDAWEATLCTLRGAHEAIAALPLDGDGGAR